MSGSRGERRQNVRSTCAAGSGWPGDRSWPGGTGDLLVVPDARHALYADEDSAVLLTVAR
ncbi:hypothetical protein O7621_23285 [Solwaraspora sp. WMMD937]|uniref:hypothetical protein n=1 Tax=Solwaraspora sp. WMMD937 TaxID=3016090 RepID=UPI00249A4C9B|nr:hypothetical protein [Solwaraspora sp. WMMD937]WFE20772.1 hypothetical protein O7621_23285 [Solwaraspora sp. WMMD937]